ncbi:hypothetical protein PRUPE_5G068400 [Prunus persica]|uniref:WAT1-related protein n=1 Tax=Prunus persica TaxID=3760 RepID=M5W9S2_PRUPE|nr:WAT1-related protein At5g47470 [Prunus persica]ONI06580.1 hypothetical protein PRUPE_5G068400 [Prunus persica]
MSVEMLRMKREVIEDVAIIGGLVGVQFVYAGNSVLLSYFMSLGLDPLTIVIFSTLATFIILSPIAAFFERHTWPSKVSLKLMIQLVLIAFGGVTVFQTLFLKGIKLTSPAMATAMPNLAPGFIFIIACTVRLERVKISCLYSKVKILGTLLCVLGAITMSIMQSTTTPAEREAQFQAHAPDVVFDKQKIIGCLYLLSAVFVLSSNIVLQATTLRDFPAPMSLCAITSLIGVFITAAIQFVQDRKIETGWPLVSAKDLVGFSLLAGTVSGVCVSFNGWAMKKRGPVLVSMFSPIGTVCSVVLSLVTLGQSISVGSFAGMCLMFTGLYFFLWAKGKEVYLDVVDLESEFDAEKPLLS